MSELHEVIDLTVPASIHVVGVGGAGMSALAIVLAQMGHTVSGSDIHESQVFDQLRRAGVDVKTGHSESNRGEAQWVTSSPAVRENNVELTSALGPCTTAAFVSHWRSAQWDGHQCRVE